MSQLPNHAAIESGFVEAVTSSFAFVDHEHGFRQVVATPDLVRNERGPRYVEVFREVGINVLFGRRARARDGPRGIWRSLRLVWGSDFPLEYVAAEVGAEEEPASARGPIDTPQDVRAEVVRLAAFVREHAVDLLVGDERFHGLMGRRARRRTRELTRSAGGRDLGRSRK